MKREQSGQRIALFIDFENLVTRIAPWAMLSAAFLAGCSAAKQTPEAVAGTCDRCHGFPPSAPSQGGARAIEDPNHPNAPNCNACHSRTVDASGALIPGGDHMNGKVDVTGGHAAGYANPMVHAPDAFANIATCQGCHGATFDGWVGPSCNACHYEMGFADWKTNCTFCHGQATPGYAAAELKKAAPPRGVAGQTDPTDPHVGAHQKHLNAGTRAGGFACGTCHVVPADLSHVNIGPVPVALEGAGQASLPPDLGTYTAADQTCAVYCHGSTLASGKTKSPPAWTAATTNGLACDACHDAPPTMAGSPPVPHSSSTNCGACHPGYTSTSVNLATHLNGMVEATNVHPSNFANPTAHGPEAIKLFQGATGALQCTSCHGATFDGGAGPSCNACHATASAKFPNGVTSWQSNCTFCHGTATEPYPSIANPVLAAPPEGVAGQIAATDSHVGAHQKHLQGGDYANAIACGTCHAVPADLSHVDGTAAVALTGTAPLPANLGTYNPTGQTCAAYCHGSGLNGGTNNTPAWTLGAQLACDACHGLPPKSGRVLTYDGLVETLHEVHVGDLNYSCASCHDATATDTYQPAISTSGKAFHVNGTTDVRFNYTGTWNAAAGTCDVACHGLGTIKVWR
jgi:predicted CxxxxCH...CXXCH cytochrome family protein